MNKKKKSIAEQNENFNQYTLPVITLVAMLLYIHMCGRDAYEDYVIFIETQTYRSFFNANIHTLCCVVGIIFLQESIKKIRQNMRKLIAKTAKFCPIKEETGVQ